MAYDLAENPAGQSHARWAYEMKESTSRILVGLEGAISCIPLTALFLYGGLPSAFYFAWNSLRIKYMLDALACLIIAATLVSAWRLLLAFIIGGRTKLKKTSFKWWILPYISAFLSPMGLLLPGGNTGTGNTAGNTGTPYQ